MAADLVHGTTLGEAGIESFSPIARIVMRQHERNANIIHHKFVGKMSAISVDENGDVHETVRLYKVANLVDAKSVVVINFINGKFADYSDWYDYNGRRVYGVKDCKFGDLLNYHINNTFPEDGDIKFGNYVTKLIDAAEWDEIQDEADLLLAMWSDTDAPFPEAARERRNELANLGADINGGWVPSR